MANSKSKELETVLAVYNTKDGDSAALALLKADIDCVRRKIGAGKYGNFLLALNHYGEEICVAPEDMERAETVLEEWRAEKKLRQEQIAQDGSKDTDLRNDSAWKARILAGAALAVVVIFYFLQRY